MARGRPTLPVEVHRFKGTYRKDRHGHMKEYTEDELPLLGDPPDHLTERQKKIWQELRLAAVPGVLRVTDSIFMEITVVLFDTFRHEPSFQVGQLNQLTKCLVRMGFGLAERNKLGIKPPENTGDNPFDKFELLR